MQIPNEEFVEFTKISRLSRNCCITEKLDGTNGLVYITESGDVFAGSRSRWITPEQDNYGFARWVEGNKEELLKLGPGKHFGEWWGQGIQRKYDQKQKWFSLFNTGKWSKRIDLKEGQQNPPECCSIVPVIYEGIFTTSDIKIALDQLQQGGSVAAPGFMKPEGVVVYHTAANCYFKKTIEKDEVPKGMQK